MTREPPMRDSPEFELIARFRERLGGGAADSAGRQAGEVGIGDDAAVTVPGGATATSIDALVDDVHFRSRWCPPGAVGHKALAAALSDLAAMGAEPGEAYVWLGRPDRLGEEETMALCDGLAALAERLGVRVMGGDLTASPNLALAVTVVGHAERPEDLVGRDGASEGDAVCLTGEVGGAAAGLMLLEHPDFGERVPEPLAEPLRDRLLRPQPRLAAGRILAACGARAMIDLSDGLGADAEQLAAASGLGLEIELERVPLARGVTEVAEAAGRDRWELATEGEDYELLCALPRSAVAGAGEALAAGGLRLTEVGRFVPSLGVRLRLAGGRSVPTGGHDHVRR